MSACIALIIALKLLTFSKAAFAVFFFFFATFTAVSDLLFAVFADASALLEFLRAVLSSISLNSLDASIFLTTSIFFSPVRLLFVTLPDYAPFTNKILLLPRFFFADSLEPGTE